MSRDSRFPPIVRRRQRPIQVVGPASGSCASIVREATERLERQGYQRVTASCLSPSDTIAERIRRDSALVVLFLSPTRADLDSNLLFSPLVGTVGLLADQYNRDGDSTVLLIEGTDLTHVESAFTHSDVEQTELPRALPTPVPADDKSDLYSAVVSQAMSL